MTPSIATTQSINEGFFARFRSAAAGFFYSTLFCGVLVAWAIFHVLSFFLSMLAAGLLLPPVSDVVYGFD